jgi:hypothetical protein
MDITFSSTLQSITPVEATNMPLTATTTVAGRQWQVESLELLFAPLVSKPESAWASAILTRSWHDSQCREVV